jgi:thymidine kinase
MNINETGSIDIIIGCMFAGKTSRLLTKANKLISIDITPLIINSSINTRDDYGQLNSHDKNKIECITLDNLMDIDKNLLNEYNYILIDESQFFSDLKIAVLYWCEKLNKKITVFGLDGDYKRQKFGQIIDLIPYADHVEKNKGYCSICKNLTPSLFSARITNDIEQNIIGSSDKYIPVCRKHYLQLNNIK